MALRQPEFVTHHLPEFAEEGDLLWSVQQEENLFQLPGVNSVLQFPSSQGRVFIGETFRGYVSLHNCDPHTVQNIMLRVEVVAPMKREVILERQIDQMHPGQNADFRVSTILQDKGVHTLTCNVAYVDSQHETRNLRKTFKFMAERALDVVGVRLYNVLEKIIVTFGVQNVSEQALLVSQVRLNPSLC
jgi:trafficking protein particle complex subunit 13